jgi:hypothetical protein
MKAILFLVVLSIFVLNINLNAQNCTAFKEGRFIYKKVTGAVSVRKDGKQISYYADSSYTEYDVAWQDSCNFTLTFFKASNPNFKVFTKGDVLQVRIIETQGNCYKFESVFKGQKFPPTFMCKEE